MKAIVIVSHSQKFADGVAELIKMTGPEQIIATAGGLEDGSLGTSYEKIKDAILGVYSADGVLVLPDLGSSVMTTEMVVEELLADGKTDIEISELHLAEEFMSLTMGLDQKPAVKDDEQDALHFTYTIKDPVGLHARPAAELVRFCQKLDAEVSVTTDEKTASCTSLIEVLTLGAQAGAELKFKICGEKAGKAKNELEQFVKANL